MTTLTLILTLNNPCDTKPDHNHAFETFCARLFSLLYGTTLASELGPLVTSFGTCMVIFILYKLRLQRQVKYHYVKCHVRHCTAFTVGYTPLILTKCALHFATVQHIALPSFAHIAHYMAPINR